MIPSSIIGKKTTTINTRIRMKKIFITIASAMFGLCALSCAALAQTNGAGTYNLQKAYEVLKENNDEEQALRLLRDQIKATPDNAEAYLLRARVYRNRKEYGSALSDINQAIKVNKPKKSGIDGSTLHWWKASIYLNLEDYGNAEAEYRTSLALSRKEKSDLVQDISFELGQVLYNQKKYDEADAVYNQMLREDETDCAAMVGLARNMIARENYQGAIDILDKAEKYSEDYSEIYRFRMQAYDKLGQTDKAIDDALTYYDKDDDPSVAMVSEMILKHKTYGLAKAKSRMNGSEEPASWSALMIQVYEDSCEYEKAIAEYDKLEQEYGKDAYIYLNRASCYSELGLVDIALSEMDKCIEMKDDAYSRSSKGDILRSAGRYEEAIAEYSVLLDMHPEIAYGYYATGWSYELSGNDGKALELYDEGIDIDQSYPYIYLMRGTYYHKHGNEEKAKADFEAVVAKDTTVSAGSCRHYALHFLGRDEEAEAWMDKIIEKEPYKPGHWYDKACLFARMGRLDDSMKAFEKCLDMGYVSFEHIRHDDDMDPVRDREDFKALMEKHEARLAERISKMDIRYEAASQTSITEVPISRRAGGTFNVDCSVNGLALNMIFDTGASDVSISKVEADFMLKNNYLSKDDIKGKQYYQTADGGISEGTVITLKEVRIGDAVLHNVNASVVKNQKAPLLLGESVLQRFGTFTVDNINSKLIIKH